MKADAEAVVVRPGEIEIGHALRELSCVQEERWGHEAIDHDAPLALHQQAVAIAEAIALEAAQIVSAAERGQEEVRDLLAALELRGLHQPAERERPRLAQDRKVLDDLVVGLPEAERIVRVLVVVQGDRGVAAAPRVASASRGPPVEADRAL